MCSSPPYCKHLRRKIGRGFGRDFGQIHLLARFQRPVGRGPKAASVRLSRYGGIHAQEEHGRTALHVGCRPAQGDGLEHVDGRGVVGRRLGLVEGARKRLFDAVREALARVIRQAGDHGI